jgi:hypothetical protein
MSDEHDKPTTISLVPSVIGFTITSVIAAVVMVLALVYNIEGAL